MTINDRHSTKAACRAATGPHRGGARTSCQTPFGPYQPIDERVEPKQVAPPTPRTGLGPEQVAQVGPELPARIRPDPTAHAGQATTSGHRLPSRCATARSSTRTTATVRLSGRPARGR